MEIELINHPLIIIGLVLAFALLIFSFLKSKHLISLYLSLGIFVMSISFALFLGFSLIEVCLITIIYLALHLICNEVYKKGGSNEL